MGTKPGIIDNIIIITGLSGAGKSTALRVFEDQHYFVVDGLPANMAFDMIEMMQKPSMKHFKGIVFGMDMRQEDFIEEYDKSIRLLSDKGINPQLLFLDASNKTLIQRYAATRRPHPMEREGIGLDAAITLERKSLEAVRKSADKIIDSSDYSIHDLRRVIQKKFNNSTLHSLRINIISFGFKYGIPSEADMVFDLRFLPNPYFIEELRPLDGQDKRISNFILSRNETKLFLDKLLDFLKLTIAQMENEGRYRVSIALGCTGGRHRSVTFAEEIAKVFSQMDFPVHIEHKHIKLD